jgi:alpha-glucosidase
MAHAPLGEPAIYVRANTAVPLWPKMNHVGERSTAPLTLLLFPADGSGKSTLYEDAGNGFGYEDGEYARQRVICEASGDGFSVRLGEREDSFVTGMLRRQLAHRALISRGEDCWCSEQSSSP